jgi:RNA polymerase sigma-54 factor
MKHRFTHQQKLLLKLALTPQMKQSVQLLAMSTKDLHEYVEQAMDANPFLKKKISQTARIPRTGLSAEQEFDAVTAVRQEENPRLGLISQLRMMGLAGKAQEIAEYLIYEMDDNGYLTVNLEEVAQELDAELEEVEEVLESIQSLDPPGIAARDIGECLKLQLVRAKQQNSLEYRIVDEHLADLARNDLTRLSLALKTDRQKIQQAIKNIKKLNPRPATSLLSKAVPEVVPDLVAEMKKQKVVLTLNRDWLPQLEFYNPYADEEKINQDQAAGKFIKENIQSAKILIDQLKRREETLCRVAAYVLDYQRDHLANDQDEIKSLTLNEVAASLHLLPLKSLLSKSVKKSDGQTTSQAAIMQKIKALINREATKKPLGDAEIKAMLAQEGINLCRRTVTKYRSKLRILPAYLRKKTE